MKRTNTYDCKHKYIKNKLGQAECDNCGLLKSTIEANDKVEQEVPEVIELVERIVIDFANLTGRETESRAEFRALVFSHIDSFMEEYKHDNEILINSILETHKQKLYKLLADMETAKDARECRHILKDLILKK